MFPPGLELQHQTGEVDALELRAERLEFRAALLEQRTEPGSIAARVVMESRRHLDEAVQESFAIASCSQPNSFESFMGFKVVLGVEEANALENPLLHSVFKFRRKSKIVNFTHCSIMRQFFEKLEF